MVVFECLTLCETLKTRGVIGGRPYCLQKSNRISSNTLSTSPPHSRCPAQGEILHQADFSSQATSGRIRRP